TGTALGGAFSGTQIPKINRPSTEYQVTVELLPKSQATREALKRLYITSNTGQLGPISAVTSIQAGPQPLSVNHSGEVPAVTISFDLPPGKTLSDPVTAIRDASTAVAGPDS